MPLAGAFFVVMLQLTLVGEGWPLRRLGRIASGPIAVVAAWAIALTLYLLLVGTHPKPGSGLYFRSGGPRLGRRVRRDPHGDRAVAGLVLRRAARLAVRQYRSRRRTTPFANLTVIVAGVVTYVILHNAIGLTHDEGQRSSRGSAHRRPIAGNAVRGAAAIQ